MPFPTDGSLSELAEAQHEGDGCTWFAFGGKICQCVSVNMLCNGLGSPKRRVIDEHAQAECTFATWLLHDFDFSHQIGREARKRWREVRRKLTGVTAGGESHDAGSDRAPRVKHDPCKGSCVLFVSFLLLFYSYSNSYFQI